jgi:hypothetical protein
VIHQTSFNSSTICGDTTKTPTTLDYIKCDGKDPAIVRHSIEPFISETIRHIFANARFRNWPVSAPHGRRPVLIIGEWKAAVSGDCCSVISDSGTWERSRVPLVPDLVHVRLNAAS